tara:strand:+ start:13103 stop:13303 length:201 start_codon:yes stop_codon:yes gene_type:complete
MEIFIVERQGAGGYDEYDAFTIIAVNADEAVRQAKHRQVGEWHALAIGVPYDGEAAGVVMESFNAG